MERVFISLYGAELHAFMKLNPKANEPIICADSGILLVKKLKYKPKSVTLIGDLDSVSKKDLEWCRKMNFKILKHPVNKDFTDGNLAINYACKNYSNKIEKIVIGGITNKLDHTLGNILPTINHIEDKHIIKFVNERQIVYLSSKSVELDNCKKHTISLIPIKDTLIKKTEGLKWGLVNEKIKPYQSRTLRNIAVNHKVKIEISSGVLMVIESW